MRDRRFPKDVLFNILKRLPLKSVWRLRLVSTEWFCLVSDPEFARCHHDLSNTATRKILLMDSGVGPSREWLTYDPDSSVPVDTTKLLNRSGCSTHLPSRSVRGLVCLGSKDGYDIHVLNPTTREFISIAHPPLPGIGGPHFRYQFCFGFDPVADKHKVLYSYYDQPTELTQHWIYTVGGAEKWRMAAVHSDYYHEKSYFHGEVCIDGVIYFLNFKYEPNGVLPRYYLAAFDLRTDSFSTVELSIPDPNDRFRSHSYRWSFIEYDGSVALVDNGLVDKENDPLLLNQVPINVWVLEDFHEQAWALKASILPPPVIIHGKRLRLACALLSGKLLLFVLIYIRLPTIGLFFCNVETDDFREETIDVPAGDAFEPGIYSGLVYSDHIDTLLPLRGLPRILDPSKEAQSSGAAVSSQLTPTVSSEGIPAPPHGLPLLLQCSSSGSSGFNERVELHLSNTQATSDETMKRRGKRARE